MSTSTKHKNCTRLSFKLFSSNWVLHQSHNRLQFIWLRFFQSSRLSGVLFLKETIIFVEETLKITFLFLERKAKIIFILSPTEFSKFPYIWKLYIPKQCYQASYYDQFINFFYRLWFPIFFTTFVVFVGLKYRILKFLFQRPFTNCYSGFLFLMKAKKIFDWKSFQSVFLLKWYLNGRKYVESFGDLLLN